MYYARTARSAPLGTTQGGNVGYREVTVEKNNGAGSLHRYTSFYEHPDFMNNGVPFAQPTSFDYLRGLLLQKRDYKVVNGIKIPVQETFNHYSVEDSHHYKFAHGIKVGINKWSDAAQRRTFHIRSYDYISQWFYQDSSKIVSYDSNGQNPVTAIKVFKYDNPAHIQPTRIETLKSNGLREIELTTYPLDYLAGSGFIDDMNTKHLVSYPIERVKYQTNLLSQTKILSGNITKYKIGGRGLVDEELALEVPSPTDLAGFKFSNRTLGILPPSGTINSFNSDQSYQSRLRITQYDTKSNILEYQVANGIKMAVLWDYSESLPVAQVKNAEQINIAFTSFEAESKGNWIYAGTPAIISTAPTGEKVYQLSNGGLSKSNLTSSQLYILRYYTTNDIAFSVAGTQGSPVKTTLSNGWNYFEHRLFGISTIDLQGSGLIDEVSLCPANSEITTYTYKPLIGLTSTTDPKGMTTYYEYDSFQRLKYIKDQNGNILKSYDYHYKP